LVFDLTAWLGHSGWAGNEGLGGETMGYFAQETGYWEKEVGFFPQETGICRRMPTFL
jgi:hypothetical protein